MAFERTVMMASLLCASNCGSAAAQDADELAKQLANPVASLISVPLQLNWDDDEKWLLNVQPVIPIALGETWNLISRTIVPLVSRSEHSGLGDITQSLFFAPKAPTARGWIIGAGPVFLLPTASDETLGSEKWGLGPTVVALRQTASGWTYGALANHIWSVAGDEDRDDISATFLQPFLSKGLGQGLTATANLESSYDWESEQWLVPLNVSASKVTKVGGQRVSFGAGVRYYIEAPDGGPEWGLRLVFTLLFPK